MATKGLLIKSYTDKTGTRGLWNDLTDTHSYIQGIRTADIKDGQQADFLAALISGLPSPWARAKLFEFALKTLNTPDPNIDSSGLTAVYEGIHGEWRGLIALIALFSDLISFSTPITLDYKGANYNIASAMGRMLFDERDIWGNQEKLVQNQDELPFLHLIYYNKILIGGTSPLTGGFTGVSYDLQGTANDIPWYRNGRLEDPTKQLNQDQLNKVYIFVRNLRNNIIDYEKKINSCRNGRRFIDLTGFKGMLQPGKSLCMQKVISDALIKSASFREDVFSFYEGNTRKVYLENIKDIRSTPEKAPFFLTGIFDQLNNEEDFGAFYTAISERYKRAFVIPAYVPGLLLYYSGILIGNTLKKYNLTQIDTIDILTFGKGGRIFHWLTNTPGRRLTKEYYRDCLNAGVKLVLDRELTVELRDDDKIREDSKAEVAKGLCFAQRLKGGSRHSMIFVERQVFVRPKGRLS